MIFKFYDKEPNEAQASYAYVVGKLKLVSLYNSLSSSNTKWENSNLRGGKFKVKATLSKLLTA